MRYLLQVADLRNAHAIPPDDLDWDELSALARPHGMEPLLFRRLSETGHDDVPDQVWARIVTAQVENARRSLSATRELLEILQEFEAAGIAALSYKGPVLAQQLYGDVAARRFGDLDIMVQPFDARAACEVLRGRGYVTEMRLPGWQFDAFVEIQKEIAFIHRDTLQEVDLQWTVTERTFGLPWDMARMWRRTRSVEVASTSVRTFAAADLALILVVHGTTHLWERLGWIADLGRFVSNDEAAWIEVFRRARELGAQRFVCCSLDLADRITGCGLPEVARAVEDDTTRTVARTLLERATSSDRRFAEHPQQPFSPLLVGLRAGIPDQVRYAVGLALTPTVGDWEAVPLPRSMRALHYLIRPVRLSIRHGIALVRAFVHRKDPAP